jgi:hypothetical protein
MARRTQIQQDGRFTVDFSRLHDHYHMVQSTIERTVKTKRTKLTFGTHSQKCDRIQPYAGVPRMNVAILITGSRSTVTARASAPMAIFASSYGRMVLNSTRLVAIRNF